MSSIFRSISPLALTLAALAFTAPAAAQSKPEAPAENVDASVDEDEAIQLALDRGLAIYRYDQAAWHVTDAMAEDLDDAAKSTLRGWVVSEEGEDLLVTFWRPDGDGYAGVYSARFQLGRPVFDRQTLDGEAAALSDSQIAQIEAINPVIDRLTAQLEDRSLELCANAPFNSVVLPPETEGDPVLVYMLTPQTRADTLPMGGHHRFTVRDGEVLDQRQFMTSCFDVPLGQSDGNEMVAIGISHVLDLVPTEIHVFSAFAAGVPVRVITARNERFWAVETTDGVPSISPVE